MDSDRYTWGDIWIGLDPSYSGFGFIGLVASHAIPGGLGTLEGQMAFPPSEAGRGGVRLARIYRVLTDFLGSLAGNYRVRGVAIEGYAPGAKFNREILGELGGITRLVVHQVYGEICGPALIVPPSSLKKFATGKGNAPKDNVLLAVFKKWGVEFKSNDLADAYTAARIAYAADNGADLEYEKQVLAQLTRTDTE